MDDTYYYYEVAKNYAQGNGVVFNITNPTNGFHPLYFYLLVPIFLISQNNLIIPIYYSLILLSLFRIGSGINIYYIGKLSYNRKAGIFASAFWLLNPYITRITLMGMEGPIQIFFISTLIHYVLKFNKSHEISLKESVIISLLLGLTILSRLDGILFFLAFLMIFFFNKMKLLKDQKRLNIKNIIRVIKIQDIIIFMVPLTILGIWMLWSYFYVGLFTPISGNIKTIKNFNLNFDEFITSIYDSFKLIFAFLINPFYYPPGGDLFQIILFILIVIPPFLFSIYLWLKKRNKFFIDQLKKLNYLLVAFILFLVYYGIIQRGIWPWYAFFPCFFLLIFYSNFLIFSLDQINQLRLKNNVMNRLTTLLKKNLKYIVIIVFIADFSFNYIYINTHYYDDDYNNLYNEIFDYIDNNIDKAEIIGSFNTGKLQYYTDRDIINLDGFINSDAYYAQINGNLTILILNYNISYLLDYVNFNKSLEECDGLDLNEVKYFGTYKDPFTGTFRRHFYLWEIIIL